MQCVYRFVDLEDNVIKYVGIVFGENRTLKQRTYEHIHYDDWCKNKAWRVEYIEVNSRSEAESLECHFIALFNTGEFFNKSKTGWGVNAFLKDTKFEWKEYCKTNSNEIQCLSYNEVDYPLKFRRVGFSTWWKIEDGFNECVVYGRYGNHGEISLSDGSHINDETIGMVYSDSWVLEFYGGDKSKITRRKYRNRKFNNIDLVAYCVDGDDVKPIKKLMLDITISRYAHDCEMRKKRYEQSYNSYIETTKKLDELHTLANAV